MPFRRAIGVLCFFFVLAHLMVWAVLDVQTPARVWADIVERPYVTIGMAGFPVAAAARADLEQLVRAPDGTTCLAAIAQADLPGGGAWGAALCLAGEGIPVRAVAVHGRYPGAAGAPPGPGESPDSRLSPIESAALTPYLGITLLRTTRSVDFGRFQRLPKNRQRLIATAYRRVFCEDKCLKRLCLLGPAQKNVIFLRKSPCGPRYQTVDSPSPAALRCQRDAKTGRSERRWCGRQKNRDR